LLPLSTRMHDRSDTDDLVITAADLEGRASIVAFWHDRFGRVTDTAVYQPVEELMLAASGPPT